MCSIAWNNDQAYIRKCHIVLKCIKKVLDKNAEAKTVGKLLSMNNRNYVSERNTILGCAFLY